jgi:hypothetical protein
LALICEKCLNVRFAEDFPEHAGDERLKLREWLKERLKREGYDPVGAGGEQQCLVFDPLEERELIYETIVRALAPRAMEKTPH